jgi:D-serine deaminase-like pyridoxal phosphate-dependent protein
MVDGAYFAGIAAALKQVGRLRPSLVIDLDRLDGNIEAIGAGVGPGTQLRIVDKSLPSIPLMKHILEKLGAVRIMSFDLPVTRGVLAAFPQVDILLGKPLPIAAFRTMFADMAAVEADDFAARTVILADGIPRLRQLSEFAGSTQRRLRVALEVDVGMHRGGLATPQAVADAAREALELGGIDLEGIMAYEAHVAAIPGFAGGSKSEDLKVRRRLAEFVDALPPQCRRIVNTGGSKTVLTYRDPGVANDLSVGSAFVKPTDFDVASLGALKPAVFIATSALKVVEARLPGPPWLTSLFQTLGAFPRKGCFLYGGHWLAKPVHPPGMRESKLWGPSSNQQFMALPADCALAPDDIVFFRPVQSEAVLWQFGPILLFRQGHIVGEWPVIVP